MALIIAYATVKGCQKYQSKLSKFTAGSEISSRKNRNSISRLVIPSLASATIIPGDSLKETDPPRYELSSEKELSENPYVSSDSPETPPIRSAPPPPVMLGLTLCESPATPPDEFDGFFGHTPSQQEIQENCPVYRLSQAFEQAEQEDMVEATSPAPLRVVKRSGSPLPLLEEEPDMIYSSEEDESHEERKRSNYLEVPESADELLSFEAPPIPPKSPARKSRVVSA